MCVSDVDLDNGIFYFTYAIIVLNLDLDLDLCLRHSLVSQSGASKDKLRLFKSDRI